MSAINIGILVYSNIGATLILRITKIKDWSSYKILKFCLVSILLSLVLTFGYGSICTNGVHF